MKKVFSNVLELLLNEEQTFRHEFKKQYNMFDDSIILCLTQLSYLNLIDLTSIKSVNDITLKISKIKHKNKNAIMHIWESINLEQYAIYILQVAKTISHANLHEYKSQKNDQILVKWLIDNYLSTYLYIITTTSDFSCSNSVALDILSECQTQLGLDITKGNILICVEDIYYLKYVLSNISSNVNYTISTHHKFGKQILPIILFLDYYSNCSFTDKNIESILNESVREQYMGIIYMESNNKIGVPIDNILEYVQKDGFCIAFNQSNKYVCDQFYQYETPFMIDMYFATMIVCKKTPDTTGFVKYANLVFNDRLDYFAHSSIRHNVLKFITSGESSVSYLSVVNKEDFKHATSSISLYDIRRPADQTNFIWKKISEIIYPANNEKALSDYSIPLNKIIKTRDLSKNPFKTSIDTSKYLNGHNKSSYSEEILYLIQLFEEFFLTRSSKKTETPLLDQISDEEFNRYWDIFENTYAEMPKWDNECEKLYKTLSCRIIDQPSLLYAGNKIARVDASPEHPICIERKKYSYVWDIGGWDLFDYVQSVIIDNKYDEDFIIYQLMNNMRNGHILVAPTKEEQHLYFVKKNKERKEVSVQEHNEYETRIIKEILNSDRFISSISFTNFRRFFEFPDLKLNNINLLVGSNNSGKSTMVKALLLIIDNLHNFKNQKVSFTNKDNVKFYFDLKTIHDINIGTFHRAFNNSCGKDDSNIKKMSFSIHLLSFVIDFELSGNTVDDKTYALIDKMTILEHTQNNLFVFDLSNKKAIFQNNNYSYPVNLDSFSNINKGKKNNLLIDLIEYVHNQILWENNLDNIEFTRNSILELMEKLEITLDNININYIAAHGVTQKVLFNYHDKNDYMAQTLRDFVSIEAENDYYEFICKWMNEFNIGKDFKISSIEGEAYTLHIKTANEQKESIADMGIGSSQLMILLLRLATILHKNKGRKNGFVIIEEPEQNLHPAMQSKLALLLYEVQQKYHLNFIVETHSEYIIRKSQVIVAQNNYKDDKALGDNPFSVFYFPDSNLPYNMEYRTDGNFKNEFGKGFFDEASNLLFEII